MRYARLFALLLMASLPCLGETAAGGKYQDVLYPQGLPVKEDPFTGQPAKTEYTFYDEAVLDPKDGRIAVLYSEKLPRKGSDGTFWAFLAVLRPEGGAYRRASAREVTDFIPAYVELPGNFQSMDGALDAFEIGGRRVLHLNVWSVLSGTGFTSAASDVFFSLEVPNELGSPVLNLEKTSSFSRTGGDSASFKTSEIYLKGNALAVETVTVSKIAGAASIRAVSTGLYEMRGAAFEKTGKSVSPEERAELVGKGLRLKRSRRIVSEQDLDRIGSNSN
jgi:hypothetical protein